MFVPLAVVALLYILLPSSLVLVFVLSSWPSGMVCFFVTKWVSPLLWWKWTLNSLLICLLVEFRGLGVFTLISLGLLPCLVAFVVPWFMSFARLIPSLIAWLSLGVLAKFLCHILLSICPLIFVAC